MNLARVFPRKTNQSPDDDLVFFEGPGLFPPQVDEVHISVAFTYDIPRAEQLALDWQGIAPIKLGGPAYNQPGGEFIPGRYLKNGITITSRGCPNKCWFCSVWKRESDGLKELEIKPGYVIQDDNFLACSEKHILAVFKMLKNQSNPPEFKGGLETKLLRDWHLELLRQVNPKSMYFAYDTKDDLEPLVYAGNKLYEHGFGWPCRAARCFVLIGYNGDTFQAAETRLRQTINAGFWPQAMLWKDEKGTEDKIWRRLSRYWARPSIYYQEAIRLGL